MPNSAVWGGTNKRGRSVIDELDVQAQVETAVEAMGLPADVAAAQADADAAATVAAAAQPVATLPAAVAGSSYAISGITGTLARTRVARDRDSFMLTELGAGGDGTTDDSAVLLAGIKAMYEHGLTLRLPPLPFAIASEVVWPIPVGATKYGWGGRIVGSGFVSDNRSAGDKYYNGARLVWTGANGGTLLHMERAFGCKFEDVGFYGRALTTGNRSGCLVDVTQTVLVGSGTHRFERCYFVDGAVGIRFGNGSIQNCDTTTFEDCGFYDCDQGWLALHLQNLGYSFGGLTTLSGCLSGIRFTRGGWFHIDMLNVNLANNAGADEWQIDTYGLNNEQGSTIGSIRIEQTSKQIARTSGPDSLHIIDFQEGGQQTDVLLLDALLGDIYIHGGLVQSKKSSTTAPFRTKGSSGFYPGIHIENTRFYETTPANFAIANYFQTDANSFPKNSLRNCKLYAGQVIPDMGWRAEGGAGAAVFGSTVSTATATLCFLGNNSVSRFDACPIVPIGVHKWVIETMAWDGTNLRYACRQTLWTERSAAGAPAIVATAALTEERNPDAMTVPSFTAHASFVCLRELVTGLTGVTLTWVARMRIVGAVNVPTL